MRWKDDVDDGEAGGGERGGRGDSRCADKEDEDPDGCCEAWRLFRTRAVFTRPSRMGSCCAEAVVRVNRGGSRIAVDGVADGRVMELLNELTDGGGDVVQIKYPPLSICGIQIYAS